MSEPSSGPRNVATLFKAFAISTFASGAITLVAIDRNSSGSGVSAASSASVIGGTLFSIAVLRFVAYVLELLSDLRDNPEILA